MKIKESKSSLLAISDLDRDDEKEKFANHLSYYDSGLSKEIEEFLISYKKELNALVVEAKLQIRNFKKILNNLNFEIDINIDTDKSISKLNADLALKNSEISTLKQTIQDLSDKQQPAYANALKDAQELLKKKYDEQEQVLAAQKKELESQAQALARQRAEQKKALAEHRQKLESQIAEAREEQERALAIQRKEFKSQIAEELRVRDERFAGLESLVNLLAANSAAATNASSAGRLMMTPSNQEEIDAQLSPVSASILFPLALSSEQGSVKGQDMSEEKSATVKPGSC